MERMSFKLTDFEGPLDLLLYLISKHKLSILDIEISELLRQYMDFIENREDKNIEAASEFVEMAARLVHIKTVMLLPKQEDEANELKSGLAAELMEYQLCKMAAQELCKRGEIHKVFVREPMEIEVDHTYLPVHSANALLEAYGGISVKLVRKQPVKPAAFNNIVKKRIVSVGSKIIYLLRRFYGNKNQSFSNIFSEQKGRSELVATFLALLELVKAGRVKISNDSTRVIFNNNRNKEQQT